MSEWISVEERLPDSDIYVLVCLRNRFMEVAYYYEDSLGEWWSPTDQIWSGKYTDYVTHWMPLPKSPEEGKQ